MLLTKFDCHNEIYISMKYILFLWNIFYFCEMYLINCKKHKIDSLFARKNFISPLFKQIFFSVKKKNIYIYI